MIQDYRTKLRWQRSERNNPPYGGHELRPVSRKRGPDGPCTDEQLLWSIRAVLADSPFHGEGCRKVCARLRFKGIRQSKGRVRRLMREHVLQASQRAGHPHGPNAHDGTIIPQKPNMMWGTH